jgi:hypothetical protein
MSNVHLGEALGVPLRWRRVAAWLTLACCLLPLTVGWVIGVQAVTLLFAHAVAWLLLCYAGLACAALGIATLWSTLLPRALGRPPLQRLRRWQVLGLLLGGCAGLVILFLLAINTRLSNLGNVLLSLTPIVWSFIAAVYLAVSTDE